MANDNDDWEVAVDTGEFDKRLEQQEKARAANQESAITSTTNDDENRNFSTMNFVNSNKPIRILKRPTSQTQLPTINNQTKTLPIASNSTISNTNSNETDNANSSSTSTNTSSSTNVSTVSTIPRIQTRDSTNASAIVTNSSTTSQVNKPAIKTYEQRELEYRLARLRIMGEEESSVKDDDDPCSDSTTTPSDDPLKSTTSPPPPSSSTSSTLRATNKVTGHSQTSLQSQSTPGSYASNLYTLNNVQANTGAIHFNTHNNSTPNVGSGPYSSVNMPQNYRNTYSVPYSHIPPAPPGNLSRYPLSTTANSPYMSSPAPFMNAPTSSPSSLSSTTTASSYPYSPQQQYSNLTTNNWYNYSYPSAPSGTQTFGHPQ